MPTSPVISRGGKERDDPPHRKPRKVPPEERLAACTAAPHSGSKGRAPVAVVTKDGRLLTTVEDVASVSPGDDAVIAPCDRCPLHGDGCSLSVRRLKGFVAAVARFATDARLTPSTRAIEATSCSPDRA